jgi:hypothetical protein
MRRFEDLSDLRVLDLRTVNCDYVSHKELCEVFGAVGPQPPLCKSGTRGP